jgi:outer membrane protein TolC
MESNRFWIGLAVLLWAGIAPAARAQTVAPPPAAPATSAPGAAGLPPAQLGPPRQHPPAGEVVELQPPPLEPGDQRFPINLGSALRLADAQPLLVAAAQASAWQAEADLQRAQVLWLPTINFGFDYIRHDGYGPDLNRGVNVPQGINALGQPDPASFGKPLNQNVNYLYSGTGMTYTPIAPSYLQYSELGGPLLPSPQMMAITDMIFQPLYERQRLNAKRWDIQRGKNDALRDTARAYFEVHRFRGKYAGALDCVGKGRALVQAITSLSKDLVPGAEVDRARNVLADLEQHAASARQDWRRGSADLTRVLRLDPRAVVEPLERDHLQITLIDPARPLDDLIPIGLINRPELAQHQALVQATLVAIRREKLRPFIPSLLLNGFQTPYELIEAGGQGIGKDGKLNLWSYRNDFSTQVLWQANNLGLGNLAMIKQQRADASQALVQLFAVQDGVAGDVTRAQADLQAAAVRVVQAEQELRSAFINYKGNLDGLQQTQRFGNVLVQIFRPQEVTFSLQLLQRGYDHYFDTVAEYNEAQFDLFHALGYPAQELAKLRPPGDAVPVDTSRPAYLPEVGTGPPPASR